MRRLCNVPDAAPFFVPTSKQDHDVFKVLQRANIAILTLSLFSNSKDTIAMVSSNRVRRGRPAPLEKHEKYIQGYLKEVDSDILIVRLWIIGTNPMPRC
jgi:hypothetical protein